MEKRFLKNNQSKMKQAIIDFPKQFSYQPEIINEDNFINKSSFVLLGMGGSHLAGDLMLKFHPDLPLTIHQDYGLPTKNTKESLIIACSYSGNTEEVLSGLEEARARNLPVVVISTGGQLLAIAQKNNLPYIQIPDDGIQPRLAVGYLFLALAKFLNQDHILTEAKKLSDSLNPSQAKEKAEGLIELLKGKIPVIYSSAQNQALAYNWKIKFNETGKIPAFYNLFPELNHNEMTGFDFTEVSHALSENFSFIILTDEEDHPQIKKRMVVLTKLYREKNLTVQEFNLTGNNNLEKTFQSLLVADWLTLHLAEYYQADPEAVPMVESFKKLLVNRP